MRAVMAWDSGGLNSRGAVARLRVCQPEHEEVIMHAVANKQPRLRSRVLVARGLHEGERSARKQAERRSEDYPHCPPPLAAAPWAENAACQRREDICARRGRGRTAEAPLRIRCTFAATSCRLGAPSRLPSPSPAGRASDRAESQEVSPPHCS